ncbi:hypothetical protein DP57_6003 [Burkholderia pseudomallei]|uniref:hypothetical protein n=1 Tax=Burkholderia pseudomallei TaxID=28450 RepID=UPI00050EDF1E|nr:hypothetical protein [Burkholderia pseudomallei]KGC70052.1 hypothetical protein DP57_6003 [Burkholderia pseudomallei]
MTGIYHLPPDEQDEGADEHTSIVVPPARHFDLTVAGFSASVRDYTQPEDVALTDYVTRAWLELASRSPTPVPRCPYCDGLRDGFKKAPWGC